MAELADGPGREPDPADHAEGAWQAWRVHRALEVLPEHERPGHRARVLARTLAERDRRLPRHPARHGEDTDEKRAGAAGGRVGGGATVSERGPDFEGSRGLKTSRADERERLHRVHELLVAASPPTRGARARAPVAPARSPEAPRRPARGRRGARGHSPSRSESQSAVATTRRPVDFVVEMNGDPGGPATLTVYELDEAGNWPMEMGDRGSRRPPGNGRPSSSSGSRGDGRARSTSAEASPTDDDGSATVPLNAPWRLDEFDGWIVVEEGSTAPVLFP